MSACTTENPHNLALTTVKQYGTLALGDLPFGRWWAFLGDGWGTKGTLRPSPVYCGQLAAPGLP